MFSLMLKVSQLWPIIETEVDPRKHNPADFALSKAAKPG
ncbi:hypothetical protein AB3S75_033800 [Citrus x aurantiifolia]